MDRPATPRRFGEYQDLMRYRIMDVLLASTPYDTYILEEAGELPERMLGEFRNLDLHYAPGLTGVATGEEALALARAERRHSLILATPHLPDMDAVELARRCRAEGLEARVVLLAWEGHELGLLAERAAASDLDRVFLWQGDARILLAIVKHVEDERNVDHDTRTAGVQVILLVEDDPRIYSSLLPALYAELLRLSQQVMSEGLNLSQKILRMRARPKILLCTTWEEAQRAFAAYGEVMLGVIADVEFPRAGRLDPQAGVELAREVLAAYPDVPILLHSSRPENETLAKRVGARFLLKGSPLLLQQLRQTMLADFGFGDFVFRRPDGVEVARATGLRGLAEALESVSAQSIAYHAARNDFSRWLKTRTEFGLAQALRRRRLSDYPDVEAVRADLIRSLAENRREQQQRVVADFDRASPEPAPDFCRIGDGSLGGKARGLAFARRLLAEHGVRQRFPGLEIAVPETAVVATGVFDRFLDENDLRDFAVRCEDDEEIRRRFRAAAFPAAAEADLAAWLEGTPWPLAVRSSSLLEDSRQQPFTGVYDTLMLANSEWSIASRTRQAIAAIRQIYASTFSRHAKAYLEATPYRLEEEKMAVLLQRIVGRGRGPRFYPDVSGVARSHNFYPVPPATAADGIAAVALGLGRTLAEGGRCLRFCPRFPERALQLGSPEEAVETTQRQFYALPLDAPDGDGMREAPFGLEVAEADGALSALASVYSADDRAIRDGLSRSGPRLVTFAPILKHRLLPLPEVLVEVLELGERGMGTPVEIEFALALERRPDRSALFGFLQMRPLALMRESEVVEVGRIEPERLLCRSSCVLGNGRLEDLQDLVVVDFLRYERARSREAAAAIGRLNVRLLEARAPYALIGVGRWGSRDPWLGIPVTWDQVSGARVIVEAGLRDLPVEPSQGSHFFQNLTAFNVGYFTVNQEQGEGLVDWQWLDAQEGEAAEAHVRHIRLARPLLVVINGRRGEGVIVKPEGA